MKFSRILLTAFVLALMVPTAKAQRNVGPLMIDPSFANNGKSEIDFEGFNNDATCFVAFPIKQPGQLNRILAAGKIYTSTPGEIRFGIVEYDSTGALESGFGTGGKADLSWDSDDYPNSIVLLPNGNILAAGASAADAGHFYPTVFQLKSDGTPDSAFGGNGRVSLQLMHGEFENLDTMHIGTGDSSFRFMATGFVFPNYPPGFYAERFNSAGTLDPTFGENGDAQLGAAINFAQGHLVDGDTIMFVGLSDTGQYPKIILCKLLPNGSPDSSFGGTNGVLNTGITLHGGDKIQSVFAPFPSPSDPYPGLLVAAPIADSSAMPPFTIVKFKLDGTLDSNYGQNGFATAPIISNMKVYGMTLHVNNGFAHVSGSIGNVCAVIQFVSDGTIDSTFGTNGVALLDADSGLRNNFMIGFEPVSKRFIGFGTSVNAVGNDDFLVARYMPGNSGVSLPPSENQKSLHVYPNPAHGFVTVETSSGAIEQITVTDALGRIVKSFERPGFAASSDSYDLDVSDIPSGAYSCMVRTAAGVSRERFTVIH